MLTQDFAQRTRGRLVEIRAALTKLREANRETIKLLTKLDKLHVADRTRLYERLGELAEDVVDKLPEEASDADFEHAYVIQEQINDLAAEIEEVSIAGTAVEDLGDDDETVREAYASLKESEAQLAKMERLGAKLSL